MIAERRLSYQLSRWSLLLLLVVAIPLVCFPVRAQNAEKEKPTAAATPAVVAEESEDGVKSSQDLDHINANPMEEAGVYHVSPFFEKLVKVVVIKRGGPYGPDHKRILEGWDYDKKTGRLAVREMVDNEKEMVTVHGKRKVPWAWRMQKPLSDVKVLIGKEAAIRGEDYTVDEAAGTVQFLKKEHCKKGVYYYISYAYGDDSSSGGSVGNHPNWALVRKFLGLHPTPEKMEDVLQTGIELVDGVEMKDVTIVIGPSSESASTKDQ